MLVSENYAFFLEGAFSIRNLKQAIITCVLLITHDFDFIFSYALALMRDETRPHDLLILIFCCLTKRELGPTQYFTFGVPSPLDDERRGSTVTLSFPRHCKIENRLNHGRDLKMMNLREQTTHDSEKTENMLIRRAVRRSKNKFAEIALVFPYNAKTFSSIMELGPLNQNPAGAILQYVPASVCLFLQTVIF